MASGSKYRLFVILGGVFSLLLMAVVYHFVDYVDPNPENLKMAAREIDTPAKMILNGYGALFFRFKLLGNINWLLIPLLIQFLVSWKKRERWEKAFVVLFVLLAGLLAVQGFFNFRYSLTLVPITMGLVLIGLWRVMDRESIRSWRPAVMAVLLLLVAFNTYHYAPWGGDAGGSSSVLTSGETEISEFTHPAYTSEEHQEAATAYPNFALYMIDDLPEGSMLLNNNLPQAYYYTQTPGVYYWSKDDEYYHQDGTSQIFAGELSSQALNRIDSLGITHVYTNRRLNNYSEVWLQFLHQHCRLLVRDSKGDELYIIAP